jgi:hypothetical protein
MSDYDVVSCGAANSAKLLLASANDVGNIQMVGKSQAPMFRGEKPGETKLAPEWTLRDVARHAVDFWLSTEDLPQASNRVTLRRDGRLQISYTASNEVPKQRLYRQLKSMLGHLGMHHDHLLGRLGAGRLEPQPEPVHVA